jgi:hypothetical protein
MAAVRQILMGCVRQSDYLLIAAALIATVVLWLRLARPDFIALAMSAALCLFVGEMACRLLDLGGPQNFVKLRWSEAPAEGEAYAYEPGSKLLFQYADNPRGYFDAANKVEGTINAHGFRGPDREFVKSDPVTRVAFLGDSFVLGFGVRDEDTLPSQFEAVLREGGEAVEALNFGITNTSTPRQVELLRDYVLSFDPDVVVIVVFLNDTDLGNFGTLDFMRIRFIPRIRRHSYFLNAAVSRIESFLVGQVMIAHYRSGFADDSPGWQRVQAALAEAKQLTEAKGIPLVVAVYPVLIDLDESYPFKAAHEKLAEYAHSLGSVFVDLREAFEGAQGPELWVHRSDQHPNEAAHRMAAAFLAREFRDRDLLHRSGPSEVPSRISRR